jgi:hypothetical protein
MSLGIVDKDVLLRHIDKSMILEELTRLVRGTRARSSGITEISRPGYLHKKPRQ